MKAFSTVDPENVEEHFDVERCDTHHRDNRSDPANKFASNIAAESLKLGNDGKWNWLSGQWVEKYQNAEN